MYTVEKLEVILTVPSIEETAAWYERVLGWTGHYDTFDAEGRCNFGSVVRGDMDAIMRGEKPFTGINLSRFQEEPSSCSAEIAHVTALIHVDDVDAVYDRVMESGVTPGSAPQNQLWGSRSIQLCWARTFWLRDLNGFTLSFVQMVEQVTLEEVRRRYEEEGEGARFEGLLIQEGLKNAGVLDHLQITRTEVWDVQDGAPFQPSTWTAISFVGDERRADPVAEMLSQSLRANWYCNMATERHTFVVFGGRVFKYPRGDERGRAEAQAYGRSLGLPEKQLDWSEDYSLGEGS